MMKFKNIFILLMLISSTLVANIATITAIKGSASIQNTKVTKTAVLGDKLKLQDSVITQEKTKVQLIFNDETIVTIGKNSNFSIKNYMFDESSEPEASFSLLKGAMRTITGKIGKIAPERFNIQTKTATIGIRGTNFTISIAENNTQSIYCTYGTINIYVDGSHFIVKQGFRLFIEHDLSSIIQAFSAKDMKELNDKNFGKSTSKKGTLSQEKQPTKALPIDTTVYSNINVVEQDIAEEQRDVIVDENTEKYIATKNNLTAGVGLTGSFASDEFNFLFLNVAPLDQDETFGENIMMTFTNTDSYTYIWYSIADSPTTYNENFHSTFTEVKLRDDNVIATGEIGSTNSFRATSDDLSPTDTMHWGDWAIEYTINGTFHNHSALWTGGETTYNPETESSIITSYTMNGALYSGIYKAMLPNSNIVNGTAKLTVDFGNDEAILVINQVDSTDVWASYSINMHPENDSAFTLSGKQDSTSADNSAGITLGGFYGSSGNDAAGSFSIEKSGSVEAEGVYQVHTNTILH